MKQFVYLGEFALAALAGEKKRGSGPDLTSMLTSAIRLYLDDRGSDRPGWPYPGFLPGTGKIAEVKLELDIEQDLWRALEREAARQQVPVSRLTSHAALYYVAELSAGRLTRHIAGDLESEEA
jgi:hypothetical protein